MATFLPGAILWSEIRKRAKKSTRLTVVSAYLGSHPDRLLKWPKQSLVVADISKATVQRGSCSAKGALLMRKKQIGILQHRDLHAKIYLFDRAAIVASANLSFDSSTRLLEAGVLLTGREVAPARREVQRIVRGSVVLEDNILRDWARVEPKREAREGPGGGGIGRTTKDLLLDGRTVWLLDTYLCEEIPREVQAKTRRKSKLAREQGIGAARIAWYSRCGRRLFRQVHEGDWIVQRWREGTRSEFGKLEGPFECLAPVDLGRGLGSARYSLALVPRKRRSVRLDARKVNTLKRVLGARQFGKDEIVLNEKAAEAVAKLLT